MILRITWIKFVDYFPPVDSQLDRGPIDLLQTSRVSSFCGRTDDTLEAADKICFDASNTCKISAKKSANEDYEYLEVFTPIISTRDPQFARGLRVVY